ncbi:MAG: D-alanine--D-alanine ligase, partial [Frankia sp.]|nr:D-alanine--D-alanine ligase [Frankia sp.]
VLASAVAMDKEYMKLVLGARGLPIGRYAVIAPSDWPARRSDVVARISADLGFPVFVKPARGGSSIGISKVDDAGALPDAVDEARRHDPKVIVEAAIDAREVECAVLGGLRGAPPEASQPAEIRVASGYVFYDFEAKYLTDATDFDIPPDLPAATIAEVQRLAVAAFQALSCEGLARVDFFITGDGTPVVNEVNTMPGFTPMSMYPRMWAASGLDYPGLVDRLIALALERGTGLR